MPRQAITGPSLHFSPRFVTRRREVRADKARAAEADGLGEDTLSKAEASATPSAQTTASRSRRVVRIAG
jgi:hypothetical protein